MHHFHQQARDNMVKGWTRIDMLLALYDRTIATVRFAACADAAGNESLFAQKLLESNRLILGLHSGLDSENSEIAKDVGRLLNFVMLRIEQKNFDEAVQFLEKLHGSFSQIREEATELEKLGKIPKIVESTAVNAFV